MFGYTDSDYDIKTKSVTLSVILQNQYYSDSSVRVFVIYLSSHARLHAGPHAWVASRVLHLHAHALPCLIHELRGEKRHST